jgi:hypothetical protein
LLHQILPYIAKFQPSYYKCQLEGIEEPIF